MFYHKKVNLSLHAHYAHYAIVSPLSDMEGAQVPNILEGGEAALPSKVLAFVWASEKPTGCRFLCLPEVLASLRTWKTCPLELNLFQHASMMDKDKVPH